MQRTLTILLALGAGGTLAAQESESQRLDQRIADWQPTRAERRFDDIGWAPDLCTALKAGSAHGRPVFLFTHDGHMQFGRC